MAKFSKSKVITEIKRQTGVVLEMHRQTGVVLEMHRQAYSWYFIYENTNNPGKTDNVNGFEVKTVCVMWLNDLSIQQWVDEAKTFIEEIGVS